MLFRVVELFVDHSFVPVLLLHETDDHPASLRLNLKATKIYADHFPHQAPSHCLFLPPSMGSFGTL